MWARKRIDIGWLDLLMGASYTLAPITRLYADEIAEAAWSDRDDLVFCLTERTGFDLLLQALALPKGSEVLVSAVTIDDMVRIIRHHGLVPVPVDLRSADVSLDQESLERAWSPQTKAILFAHLFGARIDMQPLVEWAKQRDVMIWEDCAQAFEGANYTGHAESDIAMFSFGPIKTATALYGGLIKGRDAALLRRMRVLQSDYPVQRRSSFLRRIVTYALIKAASSRFAFGLCVRLCGLTGRDYDGLVNRTVRNIPGDDFFAALRQRPSAPLLRLIARRLRSFDQQRLARRSEKGKLLAESVQGSVECPAAAAMHHSFWVFPICVANEELVLASLRRGGFDATAGSQLRAVSPPPDRPELEAKEARRLIEGMIFVPVYHEMPDHEIERLATVLKQATHQIN
jgi:dTDP-4-amino-4,6-dideoxygalactose transaminase